ncbi:MAG: DUF2207 domain-containing protein, partial [Alphaproteobacteria bacterium]|nr:DUF2207 domain-containing protein [Alphaproteobacteria bacterium]
MTKQLKRCGRWTITITLALMFSIVWSGNSTHARERIISFDSTVVIESDGSLTVTERIEVVAEGDQIKRGIYRDFPTVYAGPLGLHQRVGFEVVSIKRDGRSEPWFTENQENGVRVYIGDADRLLNTGRHVYELTYRTDRQIAFFDDFDELNWNVTGNGWNFVIEQATGRIVLPEGAEAIQATAYTGYFGSDDTDASIQLGSRAASATTTRPLQSGEGLTLAVSWPKGYVSQPSALAGLASDNIGVLIVLGGFLGLATFYGIAWHRVGRDPRKGTIIARFEGPGGLSPVATGYVWNAGFNSAFGDNEAFAAALVSLGTKGLITIEGERGNFTLTRSGEGNHPPSPGEQIIMDNFFGPWGQSKTLTRTYDSEVKSTVRELIDEVKREYRQIYHRNNRGVWLLGILVALITGLAGLALEAGAGALLFFLFFGVFAVVFGVAAWALLGALLRTVLKALRGNSALIPGSVVGLVVVGLFAAPAIFITLQTVTLVSAPMVMGLVGLVALVVSFSHLLKAPTAVGREALDHIEGYRLYLSVAETDRL